MVDEFEIISLTQIGSFNRRWAASSKMSNILDITKLTKESMKLTET